MSLHIAVSGLTSLQRILYMAHKSGSRRKEVLEHEEQQRHFKRMPVKDWIEDTSLNSLSAVYQLYFPQRLPLEKDTRDIFVKGCMEDIRADFQVSHGLHTSIPNSYFPLGADEVLFI
jgi:DNA polymerase gamma 1